jgi:hypothetical protein
MSDYMTSPMQQAAKEIERAVADVFTVHDVTLGIPQQPDAIRLRGYLQIPSHRAYPQIADRLRPMDYTAYLRRDKEQNLDELLAVPGTLPEVERPRLLVHVLLSVLPSSRRSTSVQACPSRARQMTCGGLCSTSGRVGPSL